MPDAATLIVFAASTLALLVLPGPSVVFVVARSVEHGRKAGLVSMLGIETGALVHVALAAAGLSALVASSPVVTAVLHYAGAACLLWLAVRTLRAPHEKSDLPPEPVSQGRLFRDGVLVDLLNPKTALFFLAFLPTFVDPKAGSVSTQVAILGLCFVCLATLTDGMYAILGDWMSRRLREGRAGGRGLATASGGTYAVLGALALGGGV